MLALFLLKGLLVLPVLGTCRYYERVIDRTVPLSTTILVCCVIVSWGAAAVISQSHNAGTGTGIYPICAAAVLDNPEIHVTLN